MNKSFKNEYKTLLGVGLLVILIWSLALIKWKTNPEPVVVDVTDLKAIRWLDYSPDGKKLAVASSSSVRVYDSKTYDKICDLDTTRSSRKESYLGNIWPSWSGDSRRIVSLCNSLAFKRIKTPKNTEPWKKVEEFKNHSIRRFAIWDAQNGALTADYFYGPHPGYSDTELLHPQSMRFTADDKRLIGETSPAALFDAADGKRLKIFNIKVPKYELVYYNEELGLLAVIGEKGRSVHVVDTKTDRVIWKRDNIGIQSIKWQKNVLCIVLPRANNQLLLWDGKTRQELPEPPVKFGLIPYSMYAALSDDVMVFSTIETKYSRGYEPYWLYEVVAWNYRENRVLWRTETKNFVSKVKVSPNGKFVAAIASKGFDTLGLIVFDSDGNKHFEHPTQGELYAWSPDGRYIATAIESEESNPRERTSRIEIYDVGE